MTILIWILAFVLISFWSLFAWLSHKVLQLAGQLPWEQTLQQAKDLPVPAVVAPWWQQMVDMLAPLLQTMQGVLGGLFQFVGTALPFIVGAIWVFGILAIVILTLLLTGGIWWFKRRQASTA